MLLTVSLGNTNASFGVFDGMQLVRDGRLPVQDLALLPERIGEGRFDKVVLASVTPSRTDQAVALLAMAYSLPVLIAGQDLPWSMDIDCEEPHKVGADRILNAIAAYERAKSAAIIVDAGTAVTMDLVSERGVFCGGAIAPGPTSMLNALRLFTELLPDATLDKPVSPIGRSTIEAMRAGIYWGSVGLVESLIVRIAETYGVAPRVFLTGGAAGFLAIELKWKCELMPTLTLEGLAILAARSGGRA